MKRITILKIHLYLSAFFTPFLLLMAFTGTAYLFNFKGDAKTETVRTLEGIAVVDKELVSSTLKAIDPDYSFEYIKESGSTVLTRPMTRVYYQFVKNESGFLIQKVTPNFLRRIIEVHKGHGPGMLKNLEKVLGLSLLLVILSGVWLALSTKRDMKITLILAGSGAVVLFGLFFSL